MERMPEMPEATEQYADEVPTRFERVVEWTMFHFRWLFVVPILLPLSFLFNIATEVRNRIVHALNSAPSAHHRKIEKIRKQLAEWDKSGRTTKLVNARPGWMTMSFRFPTYKDNATKISTDQLFDILELNVEKMTIKVEPGVTMGQITKFLIPRGYTLPVLPELDDLTIGGLINGCGVESASFHYGMFQHICREFEVVMANGDVEVVNKDSNGSLFYSIPWSQGTLCFLVAATIDIIPCRPYVKLTYKKTETLADMTKNLTAVDRYADNVNFVEGLLFTRDKGCIMTGQFSDGPDTDEEIVNPIGRWFKPWFYCHVEKLIDQHKETVEYIPLRDYYHRHSRSIFWELRDIVPFGNNVLFRYLLGWLCPPKIAFLKATTPNVLRKLYDRSHVLQDMLVPLDKLDECVEVFHKEVEIYPLWLCPFHLQNLPGMMSLGFDSSKMYVDVGAYGVTTKEGYHHERTTRKLEAFVRSVKGFQMTYADVYMTREEYNAMFDRNFYDFNRDKYDCDGAFPDVYEKVCRQNRR